MEQNTGGASMSRIEDADLPKYDKPQPDFEWADGIYVKRVPHSSDPQPGQSVATEMIDIRDCSGALIHRCFIDSRFYGKKFRDRVEQAENRKYPEDGD